jgi:hypothetical protein
MQRPTPLIDTGGNRREIIRRAKSLIAARIPHALLIFISFLRAFNALPTDQVTAHFHRLTMPEAAACKGRLHISRRHTHSNQRKNTHPDGASNDRMLQHFLTLPCQMDAAKAPT